MKKDALKREKRIVDVIHDSIDKGADTAEEIHKAVASFPLRLLDQSDLFKKPVRRIRTIQERNIGALYDLVRNINRRAARFASQMLRPEKAHAEKSHRPMAHAKA